MQYRLDVEAEEFEYPESQEESDSLFEYYAEFDGYPEIGGDMEWEEEVRRRRRLPMPLRRLTRRPPGSIIMRRPRPRVIFRQPSLVEGEPQGREYVRWVQSSLNQIMGLQLPLNGIMGVETRSAIRSFQERQGLPVDGIVGPDTERRLIAARSGQSAGAGNKQPTEPGDSQPPGPGENQPPEPGESEAHDTYSEFDEEYDFEGDSFETLPELDEYEEEVPVSRPRKTPFRYVRDFSGPAAECTDALRRAGKTKAEALSIINGQVGAAIAMLRKAATRLKRGSRSPDTQALFLKIFRVRPEFVPAWLKPTPLIKDRGDVVATRCKRVADLLASGKLKFFCTINSTNCPDCPNDPSDFGCSSWGGESVAPGKSNVVCLGNAFWDDMKAGRANSLLATLMHEPFHIYYGKYVTAHLTERGRFGGIYCIVQFVYETNGRAAPDRVNQRCANMVVRNEIADFLS